VARPSQSLVKGTEAEAKSGHRPNSEQGGGFHDSLAKKIFKSTPAPDRAGILAILGHDDMVQRSFAERLAFALGQRGPIHTKTVLVKDPSSAGM